MYQRINLSLLALLFFTTAALAQEDELKITSQIAYPVQIKQTEKGAAPWYQNLDGSRHDKMINHLFAKVRAGKLKAYRPTPLGQPCTKPACKMDLKAFDRMLHRVDTVYTENLATNELLPTVQETHLLNSDLVQLDFIEEWSYDNANDQFVKKVNAVAIETAVHDNTTGEFRGYRPLFYIWFNEVEFVD